MNETLNTISALPTYVLIFLVAMAVLYVLHKLTLVSALQAQAINEGQRFALVLQQESNRLRDESNRLRDESSRQSELTRLSMLSLNERSVTAITSYSAALVQQAGKLDTINTASAAIGVTTLNTNTKVNEMLMLMRGRGVERRAMLEEWEKDIQNLAELLTRPTADAQIAVAAIADRPEAAAPVVPAAMPTETPVTVTA